MAVATEQDRRMVTVTATLVDRGVLPAFRSAGGPSKRQIRLLTAQLRGILSEVGARLVDGLDDGSLRLDDEARIDAMLREDAVTLGDLIESVYLESGEVVAKRGFDEAARQLLRRGGIALDWTLHEPLMRQALQDQAFVASEKLMQRVTGDVKAVLLDGLDRGLGTQEVGANLRGVISDISTRQAEGIARTELNSASNSGAFGALDAAEVEYVQWITASDSRVRPSHVAQHAMVVRRGERFPNGLRYPGDRTGTVGEVVNCRCAVVAYFPLGSELGQATPFTGLAG